VHMRTSGAAYRGADIGSCAVGLVFALHSVM